MFAKTLTIIAVAATVLCGCTPDETEVTVNASTLRAAAEGHVGTAKVKMVFDTSLPYESETPEKIRLAALPHLGEGAVIMIEEIKHKGTPNKNNNEPDKSVTKKEDKSTTKFIATFTIPVGNAEALQKAPRSILQLRYIPDDKMFYLVYGQGMSSLNSALRKLDGGYSLEYPGGYIARFLFGGDRTTINIQNDDKISIGVAAVTVNEKAVIAGTVDTHRHSLLIDYGNHFYSGKAPCFMYGGFQTMPSRSPSAR
jgi:hypothetical protein